MQRAWKKSVSQETWTRSFDVLCSKGARRALGSFVLPKPQSRFRGDQRILTLNLFAIKLEAFPFLLHVFIYGKRHVL